MDHMLEKIDSRKHKKLILKKIAGVFLPVDAP